jgi:hypothetical protein
VHTAAHALFALRVVCSEATERRAFVALSSSRLKITRQTKSIPLSRSDLGGRPADHSSIGFCLLACLLCFCDCARSRRLSTSRPKNNSHARASCGVVVGCCALQQQRPPPPRRRDHPPPPPNNNINAPAPPSWERSTRVIPTDLVGPCPSPTTAGGAAARGKQLDLSKEGPRAMDSSSSSSRSSSSSSSSSSSHKHGPSKRRRRPGQQRTAVAVTLLLASAGAAVGGAAPSPPPGLKERILRSSAMAAAGAVALPDKISPSPGTDRCTTMIVGPKVCGELSVCVRCSESRTHRLHTNQPTTTTTTTHFPSAAPAQASADGSTMTTHTADCAECDFRLARVPAKDWPEGAMRPVYLFASACTCRGTNAVAGIDSSMALLLLLARACMCMYVCLYRDRSSGTTFPPRQHQPFLLTTRPAAGAGGAEPDVGARQLGQEPPAAQGVDQGGLLGHLGPHPTGGTSRCVCVCCGVLTWGFCWMDGWMDGLIE